MYCIGLRRWIWKSGSCGMWRRVIWLVDKFRMNLFAIYSLYMCDLQRRCRHFVSLKRNCIPLTRSGSHLAVRYMCMRKISWRMTSCYYQSWQHSDSTVAHYTSHEALDVFSLCSSRTVCRPPTSSSSVVHPVVDTTQHRTKHAHPGGYHLLAFHQCYNASLSGRGRTLKYR